MAAVNGVVLYEGESLLDGQPIVVIATFRTANKKTGEVIQTWILRSDISPVEAVATGQDVSICGKCPHRHFSGGGCYVLPFQAPNNIYKHYHLGRYPKMSPKHTVKFIDRDIRFGSYGDPAAVPIRYWLALTSICRSHTGFTHQMDHPAFTPQLLDFCQVSIEKPQDVKRYTKHGTFRIKLESQPLEEGEILCLNQSSELLCSQCKKCDGRSNNKIAANFHGNKEKRFTNKFGT